MISVWVVDIAHLRRLVEAHSGNLSSCARELAVSRQVLTRRLTSAIIEIEADQRETITLLAYAERLRASAGVKGPRSTHSAVSEQEERTKLLDAIARAGGYRPAAAVLGLSPSTVVRRIKRYGITPQDVEARRRELLPPE